MSHSAPPDVQPSYTPEHLALVVDIWKYAVGVQMHFNDMGMKIRNLYFTIIAADIGLIGVVQGRSVEIPYPNISVHLAVFALGALIPVSLLFYFLDAHWYHRLLIGTVKHCAYIENKYGQELPELRLGAAISAESPWPWPFDKRWQHLLKFVSEKRFWSDSRLHSPGKLEVLYKSVIWVVVLLLVPYALFDGVQFHHCTLPAIAFGGCGDP